MEWYAVSPLSAGLALILAGVIVGFAFSRLLRLKRGRKKKSFEKTETLLVPIELWSEFGGTLYSLSDYWDSHRVDRPEKKPFEFWVNSDVDMVNDSLWVKYIARDEKIYKFIQTDIARCNNLPGYFDSIKVMSGLPYF